MSFHTIIDDEYHIDKELSNFAKGHKIKEWKFQYNPKYDKFMVIIEWIDKHEERVEKLDTFLEPYVPSMVTWIEKMFEHSFKKEWYETYWAFDIHGTVLEPNHRKLQNEMNYYPYAKECLQILSERKDIKLIMSTSSYPEEIEFYTENFEKDGIHFDFINENSEIDSTKGNFGFYERKYYVNAVFEDKAGFNPLTDWKPIYNLFKSYQDNGYLPNPAWGTKF